eukprot:tig00000241_g21007.t1
MAFAYGLPAHSLTAERPSVPTEQRAATSAAASQLQGARRPQRAVRSFVRVPESDSERQFGLRKEFVGGPISSRQSRSAARSRLSRSVQAKATGVEAERSTSPPPRAEAGAAGDKRKSVDTLIIGAGVSGLSLAWNLKKEGVNVFVAESRPRVGGCIETRHQDGYTWEVGPNSFQPNPTLLKFITDAGLKDKLVLADGTLPRFVFWNNKLFPLPMAPADAVGFKLLSWPGKIRAGLGAMGFVRPAMAGEESLEEFVRRHLGDEAFEKLIDPFVSGVYAGDPKKLSVNAAFAKLYALEQTGGSLFAGTFKLLMQRREAAKNAPPADPNVPVAKPGELASFRDGLHMLPEHLAEELGGQERVQLGWKLLSFQPSGEGSYVAEFETPEGRRMVEARSIVISSPAYITSELVRPLHPDAADALAEIYYPPVAAVSLGYPEEAARVPLRGFGNLIPRSQKVRTLGSIWSSSLFPGRAPEGHVLISSYIGGAQDTGIAEMGAEEIAAAVDADLRKTVLKADAPRPKVLMAHLWQRAIPQFNKGHLARLERARALEEDYPGVFLTGNYVNGVSLGACLESGITLAPRVSSFLRESAPQAQAQA